MLDRCRFFVAFTRQCRFCVANRLRAFFVQFGNQRFLVAAELGVIRHFRLDTGLFGGLGRGLPVASDASKKIE